MLLHIPSVLSRDDLLHIRSQLQTGEWVDGRGTAGSQSAQAKRNLQIAPESELGRELSTFILRKLGTNPLFNSAVLPLRVVPPLFNRYDVGMRFGAHVDNALRPIPSSGGQRIRTDVSSTLFLSGPDEYEGGELLIHDSSGEQAIKLPAGDMIVYPTTALHSVSEVTHGSRWASFFWTQSLIRSQEQRTVLFDLDQSIMKLSRRVGADDPDVLRLTNVYHNLLRIWSEL
ncbi:Fe2+-dependent dioxygenase [Gluconobacter wancherniae]|uniref:Fe2+-dependent dioxygenase n=1 Tax=Gluconobacter wancherniae TaxID=1307955 RepID=UPI001B8D9FF2|nr:Fe2+-dependent dioxygenase [Gluconobacter wancherniae]MBS1094408.1 Fe2+-dependent dioxygenase [Gluconobacter wancherniae]MBS1094503.1 Fe2+-dependent dioxygenase [Gluconobacter wancherniae]